MSKRSSLFHFAGSAITLLGVFVPTVARAGLNDVLKEEGTLLKRTPEYSLYLNGMGFKCNEYNFDGKERVHWMYGYAFFDQDERLPLGDEYPAFFESVVWPLFSAAAPEACGTAALNLTRIQIDFYFEDFESTAFDKRIAEGNATRSGSAEGWNLTAQGKATMAEVLGKEAVKAARQAAHETNEPFGRARDWIEASKNPENSHPPGLSNSELLLTGESLKVYAGTVAGSPLCAASPKREGDYFLSLTMRFPRDAKVPVSNRQEYLDFFTSIYERFLKDDCPKANIASIVHYMDEQSHPRYIEEPAINRITLQRYETGQWRMAEPNTSEPIYASAREIEAARRADVASRDFATQRAERDARWRRIASSLEKGDFLAGMAELWAPSGERMDRMDEVSLDDSGVFYSGDPKRHFVHAKLILCNRSGRAMRMASAIEFAPRARGYEGAPPRETIVSGWGRLAIGECKTVRTGAGGSVFLAIVELRADGSFEPSLYETHGDFEDYSLEALNDPKREFRALKSNVRFCFKYPGGFQFRSTGAEGVTESCARGSDLLTFRHFLQIPPETEMTIELK